MVRDRVLITTMGFSLLFHLSMVTLFSIYVWVPVNRPKYAQLEIKYLQPGAILLAGLDTAPRELTIDGPPPAGGLTIGPPPSATAPLPEIALPALDTAQLERAEMIATRLRIESAFAPEARQDSWARFIGQIGKLDDRLREFTPLESVFKDETSPGVTVPIDQPAAGLRVYVEWASGPRDRRPTSSAPVDVAWLPDAASINQPVSLPFKVDAAGNVVDVLAPPAGDETLDAAAAALRQFQFAPLEDPSAGNQIGTLVIAPETER